MSKLPCNSWHHILTFMLVAYMGGDMGVPHKNILDYAAEVIPGLVLSLKPGKDGKDLSFRKDIGKDLKQLGGIL